LSGLVTESLSARDEPRDWVSFFLKIKIIIIIKGISRAFHLWKIMGPVFEILFSLEHRKMYKVPKPNKSEDSAPMPKTFRINEHVRCNHVQHNSVFFLQCYYGITYMSHISFWVLDQFEIKSKVKVKIMLRPMVSPPNLSWCQAPSGARNHVLSVRQLQVCWCGAPSLKRGRSVVYNCRWPSPVEVALC
jgi:hypothetical protein